MGKQKANGLESLDQNTIDELYKVGAFLVVNGVPEVNRDTFFVGDRTQVITQLVREHGS